MLNNPASIYIVGCIKELNEVIDNKADKLELEALRNKIEDTLDLLVQIEETFLKLMALYQRGTAVTPLSVASDRINLAAEETKKVLDANSRHRNLTITNGSSTLLIFGKLDGQNPADIIITLLPNEVYEFPNLANGSTYMGDVFIRNLTRSPASAGYTEFNAPQ